MTVKRVRMTEKRQNDGWGRHQDDDSRAVIPDLIRNLCYCQKTQILTFVRMTATISVILNLIQNQLAKS